jgi:hypothetical protein
MDDELCIIMLDGMGLDEIPYLGSIERFLQCLTY